jgi:hypothetical protein
MTAQPTNPNPRRQPDDEMLSIEEAATYLRVPVATMR